MVPGVGPHSYNPRNRRLRQENGEFQTSLLHRESLPEIKGEGEIRDKDYFDLYKDYLLRQRLKKGSSAVWELDSQGLFWRIIQLMSVGGQGHSIYFVWIFFFFEINLNSP